MPTFVFGSNELGKHGGGAARDAREKEMAVYGQGFGPQGNSFAIPTCSKPTGEPGSRIPLDKVRYYVACFLMYAATHPEREFQVTQVGCGLAGWEPEQIAPMFWSSPDNCSFDTAWKPWLTDKSNSGAERKYWGHV